MAEDGLPSPPPGIDLNADQGHRIISSMIALIILPTIFVIFRLISRRISRAGYWVRQNSFSATDLALTVKVGRLSGSWSTSTACPGNMLSQRNFAHKFHQFLCYGPCLSVIICKALLYGASGTLNMLTFASSTNQPIWTASVGIRRSREEH